MKTAYQFNASGLFVGETVADESPREPGVYLLPAGCTLKAPPAKIPAGKVPRWNGNAWQLVSEPKQNTPDPVAKLQDFLNQNPDVAALLQSNG